MRTLALPSLVLLLLSIPAGTAVGVDVAVILSADVGAYQDAIRGFRESQSHRIVASYGQLGRIDEGRAALAEQLRIEPDLTLEKIKREWVFFNPDFNSDVFEREIDGLRNAGLPE